MAETIFALASAPGPAGVAVVRVSGPAAGTALRRLAGDRRPPPRRAVLRRLRDAECALDQALVLWFPAPASFTGEDVAELHLHGGRAVGAAVLAALRVCPGLRPAAPGEFTRRAFENGKLDLTAAEGLADLVLAQTEAQRRQALRQLDGELGRLYDGWRDRLVGALARLEAAIDFPDEDLPDGLLAEVNYQILCLLPELTQHLDDGRRGERLREGVSVALIGPPNAGKSSLLNRLARREAAIVAATAGTTRDVIEVQLDLGGYPVVLADTAGLQTARDEVEAEGVRRALAHAAQADLKIVLFDACDWPEIDARTVALIDADSIVVLNKGDLTIVPEPVRIGGRPARLVSVRTGSGMNELLSVLTDAVAERMGFSEAPTLTRGRHREAVEDCRAALDRARSAGLPELVAEDLRLAVRALGRITGRVDVEDILDVVFREFCIGK
ncbi:MAG: tRNA uridine-5-carboxymethylaminomethyl(34) synthesis GTPase MnmE [Dongiaceae bacterium]